jgi:hypothetical protein
MENDACIGDPGEHIVNPNVAKVGELQSQGHVFYATKG